MTSADLPWLELIAYPFRLLTADARGGFKVSIGGAMFLSGVWMFGSTLLAWSGTALPALSWRAGLIAFVVLMLLIHRFIVALYLGTAIPTKTPQEGSFGDLIKRTKKNQTRTTVRPLEPPARRG